MEEPTGKVFARLHHMKSFLCRTLKSMIRMLRDNLLSFLFLILFQKHRNSVEEFQLVMDRIVLQKVTIQ